MIAISPESLGGGLHCCVFHEITSVANLLAAWNEFKKGKRKKRDVAQFELHLENNIFALHEALIDKTYRHEPYADFYVYDPKRRHIHRATVRDRVLHQAIFRVLYPIFNKHFIYDSYSSRSGKGVHAGVGRLEDACRKVSQNWRAHAYVLKCDVRKFFDSIDHEILRRLIAMRVADPDALALIDLLLASFSTLPGKGLPLGNVTSQLFANICLNELDQFMKNELKAKHYYRYCDDFVIVHNDRDDLCNLIPRIVDFLKEKPLLDLHPHKVEIRKVSQGIDFLGYVSLPFVKVLRTKTKQRILRKIDDAQRSLLQGRISREHFRRIVASCLGILAHCQSLALKEKIRGIVSVVD